MMQTKMMIAAIFALTLSGSAIAQRAALSANQTLALDRWVQTIDRDISDRLDAADFAPMENDTERNMAEVRFIRGANGQATNVTLVQSSGVKAIDADALEQVKELYDIQPLPAGIPPDTAVVAHFVYDTDADSPRYLRAIGSASRAEAAAEARLDAGGAR